MRRSTLFIFILIASNLFCQENEIVKKIDDKIAKYTTEYIRNSNLNRDAELIELYYHAKEIDYKKGQTAALLLICRSYVFQKKYDQILIKAKEVEKEALKSNDYETIAFIKNYVGSAFIHLNFHNEAKKNINQSISYSKFVKNNQEKNILNYNNYIYLAKYYQINKKKDSSFLSINDALQISSQLNNFSKENNYHQTEGSLHMAEFYIIEKHPKKAQIHLESISKSKKNLFQNADYFFLKAKTTHMLKDDIVSLKLYKKADSLASSVNYTFLKTKIYADLALYYQNKKDIKKHIYYLKKNNTIKDSLENISRAQIDKINQLTKKEDLFFSQNRYNLLITISALALLIILYKRNKTIFKTKNLIVNRKESNIKENQILISDLTYLASENDPTFYIKFKKLFPDFEGKILAINSSLKPIDFEFCAFIKLNFSAKQIATIKNLSVRAVEGRKYRIRKALEITQNENMYVWISKL